MMQLETVIYSACSAQRGAIPGSAAYNHYHQRSLPTSSGAAGGMNDSLDPLHNRSMSNLDGAHYDYHHAL